MLKSELIRAVASRLEGASMNDVRYVLDVTEDVVSEVIKSRDEVPLFKYMKVYGKEEKPMKRKNPLTGEFFDAPARTVPKAKFTYTYRRRLNDGGWRKNG